MNSRSLNAIRDALSLVRNSKVIEATGVIRAALSGGKIEVADDVANSKLLRIPTTISSPSNASTNSVSKTSSARTLEPKKIEKFGSAKAPRAPSVTGDFTSRNFRHSERNLSYMLYVPSHSSGREQSLLLMLHGCTQNPTDFALGTQMNRLADEFNIIVAYPLQPKTANSSGCWNWFDARHQKHGFGEPAVLAALTESLRSQFSVAENRVFAAGLSAGGAMAEILASTYPQQFSAVGVHSGLPYGAASSLAHAFGAMKGTSKIEPRLDTKIERQSRRIVFHGSTDATVHPSNADRIVNHARRHSSKLTHVEFTKELNGRSVTRTILQDENGASVIEQWVVTGGGHAWFGGNGQGSYTDPKGPDASREMVRFFLRDDV